MYVDVQQGANNEVAEKCVAFFIRFRLRCNICFFFRNIPQQKSLDEEPDVDDETEDRFVKIKLHFVNIF